MNYKLFLSIIFAMILCTSFVFASSFPVDGSKNKDLREIKELMQFSQRQAPFVVNGIIQFPYTYEFYNMDNTTYISTSKYDVFRYPLSSYNRCLIGAHSDGKKLAGNNEAYCLSVINRIFVAKVQLLMVKQYEQIQKDDQTPRNRVPEFVIGNLKP